MQEWAKAIAQVTDNPFEALLSHKMDTKGKKLKENGAGAGGGGGDGVAYGDFDKLQNGCMQLLLWFVFVDFRAYGLSLLPWFHFFLMISLSLAHKEKTNFQSIMVPQQK